ncbi:uncharacterized protein PGTG_21082 [Puccinia graminis f. sp. tritici CRL 75-36-700-3]|uniref:Uncharacterized protein n=1 Tax=Puccinia graminis f. sp. tritici (strain CRL 75-36-700-3 / race SCCL) TaxID=418459 RepID=H6QQC2_PUCGT|nr:uncharacterized protein PGTG_21082 [Puccinia graminis f. sp. tritici CRL 75-36-700-3]EHS62533.1 hypothetical protein PGTG_21082 [Puccinia graminis f. sp. tritici CRL 75-36-700-3]
MVQPDARSDKTQNSRQPRPREAYLDDRARIYYQASHPALVGPRHPGAPPLAPCRGTSEHQPRRRQEHKEFFEAQAATKKSTKMSEHKCERLHSRELIHSFPGELLLETSSSGTT